MRVSFVAGGALILVAVAIFVSCAVISNSSENGDQPRSRTPKDQAGEKDSVDSETLAKQLLEQPGFRVHSGMCDASAGIAIQGGRFLAANDEDNTLRLYDAQKSGAPTKSFDLNQFLEVGPEHREADLEGAARVGNRIYWIGSHGRNRNGHWRRGRHVFFATELSEQGGSLLVTPVGNVYRQLVVDIVAEPLHRELKLAKHIQADDAVDADLAPKDNGFNIESLARSPDGTGLLIGLRNPLHKKKAIVLWLENPGALISSEQKPTWKEPLLFDLDGRGLRSMIQLPVSKQYLLIAGPKDGSHRFAFFTWSGQRSEQPTFIDNIEEPLLNPEALLVHDDGQLQILSDNGSTLMSDQPCKDATDPSQRRFFSRMMTLKDGEILSP